MSATYKKISGPSAGRVTKVEAVEAGDIINLKSVLGRSARKIQFIMTDAADVVEYRLNVLESKLRARDIERGEYGTNVPKEEVLVYNGSTRYPTFSSTGSEVIETADGLQISSIEIVSLTLSVGTEIELIVW